MDAAFQGVGWHFPVELGDRAGVRLAWHDEPVVDLRHDRIRQSIWLILSTAKGERVMRPTFGCGIHDYVFGPADSGTAALISFEVREALLDWEPRIKLLEVRVTPDAAEGNKLLIAIDYRVRSTNSVFNLVYPFYLQRSSG